jgi:hypothetical protein
VIARAREDARITGGAITGSASIGQEDRWSDIDLAFGVRDASDMLPVLADFTRYMYETHAAVDTVDVLSNAWIYRVFLLHNTLQVDIAVAPQACYGARAPTFRLVFGTAAELPHVQPARAEDLIGLAWLYALHVRSSIKRGKYWQAEYMVSAMRDHVLALACLRLGLPAREGRGLHQLPKDVTDPMTQALVGGLDPETLTRALRVTSDALLREAGMVSAEHAERIAGVVRELAAG